MAAAYVALPFWRAVREQVPAANIFKVEPDIEHTDGVVELTNTAKPEVAVGVSVAVAFTARSPGLVNVIV